jgi:hypothetical protein
MDLSQMNWRKSSRSIGGNEECVEVAAANTIVAIRDSKNPDRSVHLIPRTRFRTLVTRIKHGDLSA